LGAHTIMVAPIKHGDRPARPRSFGSLGSVLAAWLSWSSHGPPETGSEDWAVSPGRWPSDGELEDDQSERGDPAP
jgi:hypothetical protein